LGLEGGDFHEGGSFEGYSSNEYLSESDSDDNDKEFYVVSSDDSQFEGGA
jgi:hypothetical protein